MPASSSSAVLSSALWLGFMAKAESCWFRASCSSSSVLKWSRFGVGLLETSSRGLEVGPWLALPAVSFFLKNSLPLAAAPLQGLWSAWVAMSRWLLSRCHCVPHCVHVDELSEGCFIHPFVDVDSTFGAFQVPRGFSQVVLACVRLVSLLC